MKAIPNGEKGLWKKLLIIALVSIAVYLLYAATLQPLVTSLFVPSIEYSGVDLYLEERYMEFDHSEAFSECISYVPFTEDPDIRHFAFYDSRWRDSIFYGRFPDVYVLDIDAGIQYEDIKLFIIKNGEEVYDETYFWLENASPSDDIIFLVRPYDDDQIVRCTMLSHYDNDFQGALNACNTLGMYFPFDLVGQSYASDN